MNNTFNATILILPGLGNSGEQHWQTQWERKFAFTRIKQRDWDTPIKDEWIDTVQYEILKHDVSKVILVGHSLACSTIVFWAEKFQQKIKGALLVAPSDTEAESYPWGTTGFKPMPSYTLQFPSIIVTSNNDLYVTPDRAEYFAKSWGSELINIGPAGHINVGSGHGAWNDGLHYLRRLDA